MSVSGVSFYQQDLNFWQQARAQGQASDAQAALINVMGQAEVNYAKGMASIANGTALQRTNNQITALVEQALNGSSSSSSGSAGSSSSGASSTTSGASTASTKTTTPATVKSTVRLTTATSLSTLGIPSGGSITVADGPNITTYTSTGSDTVGSLINTLNIDLPTNAQVTASLNSKGQLVITSRNNKDTIAISGVYASNLGFGTSNDTASPVTTKSPAPASASAASSKSSASTSSSKSSSALPSNLALSVQGGSTAASIMSSAGVSGNLVDLLT
jgi:hypothetical protein